MRILLNTQYIDGINVVAGIHQEVAFSIIGHADGRVEFQYDSKNPVFVKDHGHGRVILNTNKDNLKLDPE